jgi:hypothetical protein
MLVLTIPKIIHYKFQVLLDEKGDDGNQTKVLNAYKIDGIPIQFVIDRKGNTETLANEVSTMIELAKRADF